MWSIFNENLVSKLTFAVSIRHIRYQRLSTKKGKYLTNNFYIGYIMLKLQ